MKISHTRLSHGYICGGQVATKTQRHKDTHLCAETYLPQNSYVLAGLNFITSVCRHKELFRRNHEQFALIVLQVPVR
ncbi:MAG: hypothetical protein KJ666_07405 [Bacteroidetes bacterium]|nr:hypothetical protein [Bacteroidota bacterium]